MWKWGACTSCKFTYWAGLHWYQARFIAPFCHLWLLGLSELSGVKSYSQARYACIRCLKNCKQTQPDSGSATDFHKRSPTFAALQLLSLLSPMFRKCSPNSYLMLLVAGKNGHILDTNKKLKEAMTFPKIYFHAISAAWSNPVLRSQQIYYHNKNSAGFLFFYWTDYFWC